jgi:hypothetical protein
MEYADLDEQTFDYDQLSPEARQGVQGAATKIRRLGKKTIENLIEIGRYLHEVNELLPHGQWGVWLQAEFAWSETSARRFMDIFMLFESANLANLPRLMTLAPSSVAELAAPSIPEVARREILDKVEQGQQVPHKRVKEIIKRYKSDSAPVPEQSPKIYAVDPVAPQSALLKPLLAFERALPARWKAEANQIKKELDDMSAADRKALLVRINHLWPALLTLRSLYQTQRTWCTMCDASDQQVAHMISGKYGNICNECIDRAAASISQVEAAAA